MSRSLSLALCVIILGLFPGCSYQFQGTRNSLKDLGIQKIYVASFRNDTYRPGIEQLFTSAIVREIGRSRIFELVNSEEKADAVLRGTITVASDSPNSTKRLEVGVKGKESYHSFDIANDFNSNVSCAVSLEDKKGRKVFFSTVSDGKIHPGAAQLGDAGATAPLINDSEQRLAIQFLAVNMMASVYQRLIDTF